jgi:hypothetical protein
MISPSSVTHLTRTRTLRWNAMALATYELEQIMKLPNANIIVFSKYRSYSIKSQAGLAHPPSSSATRDASSTVASSIRFPTILLFGTKRTLNEKLYFFNMSLEVISSSVTTFYNLPPAPASRASK